MKNRSAALLLFMLISTSSVGLIDAAEAQQPRASESSSAATGAKCPVFVTVNGAVHAPARLELRRRVRLSEALAVVGGITEWATAKIQITHTAPSDSGCNASDTNKSSEHLVETFNLAGLLLDNEKSNPYLLPGDIVNVLEAAGVAYIIGNVVSPQAIILRDSYTLTRALAIAGGLLSSASTDKIYLYRQSPKDATLTTIRIDLKAIRKGRAEDLLLEPYDIVEVRDKRSQIWRPIFPVKPQPIGHTYRVIY